MFFFIFFFHFCFGLIQPTPPLPASFENSKTKKIPKKKQTKITKQNKNEQKKLEQPAHVKACFLGSSLTLPISEGRLALGTWQGIWLCEHRNQAGSRKLMITLQGCLRAGDSNNLGSSSGMRSSGRSPAGANPGADSPLASTSSS